MVLPRHGTIGPPEQGARYIFRNFQGKDPMDVLNYTKEVYKELGNL